MRTLPLLGVLLLAAIVQAQQPPPDAPTPEQRSKKEAQYLRIEYERCRTDLIEVWTKGDAAEARAKQLEADVQKLTDELMQLKGAKSAPATN